MIRLVNWQFGKVREESKMKQIAGILICNGVKKESPVRTATIYSGEHHLFKELF